MRGNGLLVNKTGSEDNPVDPQLTIVIRPDEDSEDTISAEEATNMALREFGVSEEDMWEDDSDLITQFLPMFNLFNINWKEEKLVKFLSRLNYKIVYNEDETGEKYPIALSKGESPEDYTESNILEVFNDITQDILLDWLISFRPHKI